ncbi:MAG: hypothetical protein WC785_01565 [Tatlockia sp.]|jgi:hypothetical protein
MKEMPALKRGVAWCALFFLSAKVWALPFTIAPAPNTIFPASINSGQPVTAFYTVTNNTKLTFSGVYLASLPPAVMPLNTNLSLPDAPCTPPFTLPAGGSCTMGFLITGAVNNPVNANNAILCIPGAPKTCQGFPVTIPSSGWQLSASVSNGSFAGYVELLLSNTSTLFAAGHSDNEFSALWRYANGIWSTIFQGSALTTGSGSTFQALTFKDAVHGFIGGHNNAFGTVYSLDTSTNPALVVDLQFKNHTFTPGGQQEYPYEVDSLLYYVPNNLLYVGGEVNTDTINNYGAVYAFDGTTWTNLALENANFVDSLAISNGILYAAIIGYGVNFAEVFSYPVAGGSWADTYLPNSIIEIHSLVVDSKGVLYAGGYDNHGGTVWKYQSGQWVSLGFTGGSDIKSLVIGPGDVLYATGVNTNYGGGVWAYAKGVWTTLSPGSSSLINSIALLQGSLFAAGQTYVAEQSIWQR